MSVPPPHDTTPCARDQRSRDRRDLVYFSDERWTDAGVFHRSHHQLRTVPAVPLPPVAIDDEPPDRGVIIGLADLAIEERIEVERLPLRAGDADLQQRVEGLIVLRSDADAFAQAIRIVRARSQKIAVW